MMNEIRELLADNQHAIWAHWMKYLFSVSDTNPDGTVVIPAEKVKHWQRQIDTAYADLSEREKESDRHQADKVIAVLPEQSPWTTIVPGDAGTLPDNWRSVDVSYLDTEKSRFRVIAAYYDNGWRHSETARPLPDWAVVYAWRERPDPAPYPGE